MANLISIALSGGLAAVLSATLIADAAACGRTRDVVLTLSFEAIDENGNPTIRTVQRVQRAARANFGTRCDRAAQRTAEERACILGISTVARELGAADGGGAEQIACQDLARLEPDEAKSYQTAGAYRLAGVGLSCNLRHQRLQSPPQLALALEPSGENFECGAGGEVREVGTLDERCEAFADLSQTMQSLSAEASCAAPEGEDAADGDFFNFCLSAGVEEAQARFEAQKAALQQCVVDPPIAALAPDPDAEPPLIDDDVASVEPVDPFDDESGEADLGEDAEAIPEPGDPSLAGTGAVDPFFEPEIDEADAEAEPSPGDPTLAGTGAVDPFFEPDVADEAGEDAEIAPGDESLAGSGAVDPFFTPESPGEGEDAAVDEAGLDGAEGEGATAAVPGPPQTTCEADETRSRFIAEVAGGLQCEGLKGIPQGIAGDDACSPRFSALKDQYYALQLEQIASCIAALRL